MLKDINNKIMLKMLYIKKNKEKKKILIIENFKDDNGALIFYKILRICIN